MNEEEAEATDAIPSCEIASAMEMEDVDSATTTAVEVAATTKETTGGPTKKPRKRKKQIYNLIRLQMEFYFSDANLSKDRFLKKLIAEDPCKVLCNVFK